MLAIHRISLPVWNSLFPSTLSRDGPRGLGAPTGNKTCMGVWPLGYQKPLNVGNLGWKKEFDASKDKIKLMYLFPDLFSHCSGTE